MVGFKAPEVGGNALQFATWNLCRSRQVVVRLPHRAPEVVFWRPNTRADFTTHRTTFGGYDVLW